MSAEDAWARLLGKTPLPKWNALALLTLPNGKTEVMSKGELVAWLRNADLHDLAREASHRRVPFGRILCLDVSSEEHAPSFFVLPRLTTEPT